MGGNGALQATQSTITTPGEVVSLSFEQERLWVLHRLHEGGSALNAPVVVRLRGELHVEALRRSLEALVARHEPLRTVFGRDELPMALVLPPPRVELPVTDLTAVSTADSEPRWRPLVETEVARPFDLSRLPLLRALLIRLDPTEHILVLTAHHIVVDRWSMSILCCELGPAYRAYRSGATPHFDPLPARYRDYVAKQRSELAGPRLDAELAHWRRALADAAPLELPPDRPRPRRPRHRPGSLTLPLPPDLFDEVTRYARSQRTTPFTVVVTGLMAMLARWTGQWDVCIGAPVATRMQADFVPLVGMFLNNIVLRADLSSQPSFAEAVGLVKATMLDALDHRELPFALLVQDLQPPRDPSRTPLFQIAANMMNVRELAVELVDLVCEPMFPPVPGANYDLTVYIKPGRPRSEVTAVYDADLYTQETVAELLHQLLLFLEQAVREPQRTVGTYTLVTERARTALPDPTAPLGTSFHGSVLDLIAKHAGSDRPAVVGAGLCLTYADLDRLAGRLAGRLRNGGVQPGDIVAIEAARHPALVVAVLAVLRAGAGFLLLDAAHPPERLAVQVRRARPAGWIHLDIGSGQAPLPSPGPVRCRLTVDLHDATPEPALPVPPLGPGDIAYVAFTSGSEGEPKGVVGNHGSLTHFLPWQRETFQLAESDVFCLLSGLSHDPLQRDMFTPVCIGAKVVVPDPDHMGEPGWLANWLDSARVTVAHLTPSLARFIVAGSAPDRPPIPYLRLAFFTGEPLLRADLAAFQAMFPNARCINSYGTTETERAVAIRDASSDGVGQTVPAGWGIADVQLLILTGSDGLAGVGELGEVCFRSPHLATGYLDESPDRGSRFGVNPLTGRFDDRLYRTGDLGRYRPNGEVTLVGRLDDQIQIRGFRVEPREVENALRDHPSVASAVVLPSSHGGDSSPWLAAFVVADQRPAPTTDDLRRHLRSRLPDYLVPASILLVDIIATTPNGKVDRRALLARLTDHPTESKVAPSTPLERTIATMWTDLLKVPEVGANENFFEIGGHSILGIQLLARIRDTCGVELPLVRLFGAPTVADLALAVLVEQMALVEGR